jgi:hypothetical protein
LPFLGKVEKISTFIRLVLETNSSSSEAGRAEQASLQSLFSTKKFTMFTKQLTLAAAALLLSAGASAQVGLTTDLGTTGVGAHVVLPMGSTLNARLGANYFQRDFSKSLGQVNYDLKGKLQTGDILVDWYVRDASSFHLSTGLVYNGNKLEGRGTPRASRFTLNGNTYSVAQVGVLEAGVEYRKLAPYLGFGWGNALTVEQAAGASTPTSAPTSWARPNVSLAASAAAPRPPSAMTMIQDVAVERQRAATMPAS